MKRISILLILLFHSSIYALVFDTARMGFAGKGCPKGSVQLKSSPAGPGNFKVEFDFSKFQFELAEDQTMNRISCSIAVPLTMLDKKHKFQIATSDMEFEIKVKQPVSADSVLRIDQFFEGVKSPGMKEFFWKAQIDKKVTESKMIPSKEMLWSVCDQSTVFRLNISLRTKKSKAKFASLKMTPLTLNLMSKACLQ